MAADGCSNRPAGPSASSAASSSTPRPRTRGRISWSQSANVQPGPCTPLGPPPGHVEAETVAEALPRVAA
eukprot:602988-Lingulodinium_polyedra.AAC.1